LRESDLLATRLVVDSFASSTLQFSDAGGRVSVLPAGDRRIACGDAAISFDPIASQGLLNAVRTGGAAAATLIATDIDRAMSNYCQEIAEVWDIYCKRRSSHYARLWQP
jgi:flavin-dependent dehydrogenase